MSESKTIEVRSDVPKTGLAGLRENWKSDLLSGFLVFLIALPLCLAIATACGYPPIAGIFTAVIGGIVTTFISNSELTIKGPAAGLIVIAIGCVNDFGGNGLAGGWDAADMHAYRLALGVGVAAGVMQILFGVFRTGILGEFFPTSAVHGMLAAIGVIIIAKQYPIALGVDGKGGPLKLLAELPEKVMHMNPAIALIGISSLIILFGWPLIKNKHFKMIPAPLIVVVIAIPLGIYLGLSQDHDYLFQGKQYQVGQSYLVPVPDSMFSAITTPDFSGLAEAKAWKWVIMFALIGSLESLLSAKAIDTIDPWRRKTNLDRDLLAVGIGNTLSACVGGLPMISEIVRSKANIDNGARTRFSDLFHGLFLLAFVALLPALIHRIPLAALAAMLIYTGFRLASPREFAHVYKIGREQFVIFATTIVATLATDLLIGIAIGIAVEFAFYILHGVPLRSLFKPHLEIEQVGEGSFVISVHHSALFSSWIPFKRKMEGLEDSKKVVLDLSQTRLVDHTVMEKLHELQREFEQRDCTLVITGLEDHRKFSDHPLAGRKKKIARSALPDAPRRL